MRVERNTFMQPQILTAAESTTPEFFFFNVNREVKKNLSAPRYFLSLCPKPWEGISE